MRKAARVDANQGEIVSALKQAGCSVQSLAAVGDGVPDLLVGRAGVNYCLEVKDGSKSPSRRRLTSDQFTWTVAWNGQVDVVKDVTEALTAVGL